jgi:chromosome segregation ATPase
MLQIMKIYRLLSCLFFLSACTTETAAPGRSVIIAPQKSAAISTAPVVASVTRVARSVDAAESRAVTTGDELHKTELAIENARIVAGENAAMRAALDQVMISLQASRSSNGELLKELASLKTERSTLQSETEKLTRDAAAKESEVVGLRQALGQANQDLTAQAGTIEKLNKSNAGLIKQAASAGVYRAWVIGLAITLVILALARVALKTLKPSII